MVKFAVVFVTVMWLQRAGRTLHSHSCVNVSLIFIWYNLLSQNRPLELYPASVSIIL
jgi:hypothetical protein